MDTFVADNQISQRAEGYYLPDFPKVLEVKLPHEDRIRIQAIQSE